LDDEPNKLTREVLEQTGDKKEITIMQESEVGLTSKQLAAKTHEVMNISINTRKLREQYLYPLSNMGIINMIKSTINRNENIYSPVEDSVFSIFDDDKDSRLTIVDSDLWPSKSVLEKEYGIIIEQEDKRGLENCIFQRYKVLDIDGIEISVSELIDKYLSNPEICFKRQNTIITSDNGPTSEDQKK